MKFRDATRDDIELVASWINNADECLTWAGPKIFFPIEIPQLLTALEFGTVMCVVMESEDGLLAFGQIREFAHGRKHLSRIIVSPHARSRGMGKLFVKELIAKARGMNSRTISLNVMKNNPVAINLYTELGFIAPEPQPAGLRANITYMELIEHRL